jgi:hypothetical protein
MGTAGQKTTKPTSDDAIRVSRERAEQLRFDLFHDEQRRAFATVPVSDHRETWQIRSRDFKLWVTSTLFERLGTAPKSLVAAVVEEFEVRAICQGREEPVHVRVAERGGRLYIDLANPHWQVVEIGGDEWRILDDSAVKFRRAVGMSPLPHPQLGGRVRALSEFLNLRSAEDEILLLTWLSYIFQLSCPYPIVSLSGVQGAGKSTIAKVLRSLIDPSCVPLTAIPKSERDLAIAATNSYVITLDNISDISQQLSDSLCRVATGGSFRCRKLYTDNDEMLFRFQRPVILNGIEELPMRPDLLDRTILIHLEPIPPERRRDETAFWSAFSQAQPQILGSLFTVASAGRQRVTDVRIPRLPRMGDFARWGVAVEDLLGFREGDFLAAYEANLEHANSLALEASSVAWTIHEYLRAARRFEGTALELLQALTNFTTEAEGQPSLVRKNPRFPKAANQLSGELDRIQPNLLKLGITVERWRTNKRRYIRLALRGSDSETKHASSSSSHRHVANF